MNVTNKKQIILAGQTLIERGTSNFFYCNQSSAPFTLRMSDGSSLIMSSRRKIKMQEPLDIFYLENTSDQDINLEYTMGFGEFSDDSMYIEGEIFVASTQDKHVNILPKKLSIKTPPSELTIGVDGSLTIDPCQFAFCRLQNISTNNMRLYVQNGFVISPMGIEELQIKEPFVVYGIAGDKLVFGGFN